MRIALCESNAGDAQRFLNVLENVRSRLSFDAEADIYSCAEVLISALSEGADYDMIIMAIRLSGMDGVKAAHRIRECCPKTKFAFVTVTPERAVDAFSLGALHYILKPLDSEHLTVLFKRFFELTDRPMHIISVSGKGKRVYSLCVDKLIKVQSANKGVDIFLDDDLKPTHIPVSFMRMESELDRRHFLKLSRGLIVRMDQIQCMEKTFCRLKDGTEVLLSRKNRTEMHGIYDKWRRTHWQSAAT